jgi:phosphotransferase system enzyme I (PtsP)
LNTKDVMNKRNYLTLFRNTGEITALLAHNNDISIMIQQMVEMLAEQFSANVCSIYLLNDDSQELILNATFGLKKSAIGNVKLNIGEGLVGLVMQTCEPIIDNHASKNPHFQYIPEIGEEAFDSFIAIPIVRGADKIGVLVLQRLEINHFLNEDIIALEAVATQLAGMIETAKVILIEPQKNTPMTFVTTKEMLTIKGQPASPGVASGTALIYEQLTFTDSKTDSVIGQLTGLEAIKKLENAIKISVEQIETMQKTLEQKLPEATNLIFAAHLMMLRDSSFSGAMFKLIEDGASLQDSIKEISNKFIHIFSNSPHAYMREKTDDIQDITWRLENNLDSNSNKNTKQFGIQDKIIIASTIYPSDVVKLVLEKANGLILTDGGVTSHVSIIARSLNLPLVISNDQTLKNLTHKHNIIFDGAGGDIYINPTEQTIETFNDEIYNTFSAEDFADQMQPKTFTKDGTRILLHANINLLGELKTAKALKAEGIGLYRTEFPFLVRSTFPTEEEQIETYSKLISAFENQPVCLRTLDVGGDKVLAYYDHGDDANPELGLRSIRFTLKHPTMFAKQLSAILRAGAKTTDLNIMFPMISSIDELDKSIELLNDVKAKLKKQNVDFCENPKLGIMIELPSVLSILDSLAEMVDFFCIGTNDFVQYMLAVDRGNEKIAEYYCPHHPAVLRALKQIVEQGQKSNIDISICGEMAHQMKYIPFLLGIGIRKISLDPQHMPTVQQFISNITIDEAENQANIILTKNRITEIAKLLS